MRGPNARSLRPSPSLFPVRSWTTLSIYPVSDGDGTGAVSWRNMFGFGHSADETKHQGVTKESWSTHLSSYTGLRSTSKIIFLSLPLRECETNADHIWSQNRYMPIVFKIYGKFCKASCPHSHEHNSTTLQRSIIQDTPKRFVSAPYRASLLVLI